MPQVLFIQGGGGRDVHDAWDDKLVGSLSRELGPVAQVRYPRMPDEDDPSYAKWKPEIEREIAELGGGAVLVGHSIGGAMLMAVLTEQTPDRAPPGTLGAIVLVSAPFVGKHGWPGDEFELPPDLGARLPSGVPVHIFHGLDDETAPPSHADLYGRAVPQAQVHKLPGRDHQLNEDLSEVAEVVKRLARAHAS